MGHNNKEKKPRPERIGFAKLFYEALPEIITFQLFTKVIILVMAGVISFVAKYLASAGSGRIFTSSNTKNFFFSPQGWLIIAAGIVVIFIYVAMDILAQMKFCDEVLTGKQDGFFATIKFGFGLIKKFITPGGISILLYIIIAVPLCGIGFAISLTKGGGFPDFMMEKVADTIPLFILYYGGIALLIILGFIYIFSVHGVIVDGLTPKEAKKQSIRIMQKNWTHFVPVFLLNYLIVTLVQRAAHYVLDVLPLDLMQKHFEGLPTGSIVKIDSLSSVGEFVEDVMTNPNINAFWIRTVTCFLVMLGTYAYFLITIVSHGYLMLIFTKLFRQYRFGFETYKPRPKKASYWTRFWIVIGTVVAVFVVSLVVAESFNSYIVYGEPVKVVAHRAGGNKGPENSIEGIDVAIESEIFASEIDIQRTKDGEYVVYHDSSLKRLAGIDKRIRDLTLAEIRQIEIKDSHGTGETVKIPTLEEALDAAKDNETLYLELKSSGDYQEMVDEVVDIINEREQAEEVALVSMNSDIIKYAETTYPEFETGFIYYANYGSLDKLPCDMLIMEEKLLSINDVIRAHRRDRKVVVWTVNSRDLLYTVLNSQAYAVFGGNVDAIITDNIDLAKQVQKELDERSDIFRIRDVFAGLDYNMGE